MFSRLNRLESSLRHMRRSRVKLLYYLAIEEGSLRLLNVDRAMGSDSLGVHLPKGDRRGGPLQKKLRMTEQK